VLYGASKAAAGVLNSRIIFKNFILNRINYIQSNNPLKKFELAKVCQMLDTVRVKLENGLNRPRMGLLGCLDIMVSSWL